MSRSAQYWVYAMIFLLLARTTTSSGIMAAIEHVAFFLAFVGCAVISLTYWVRDWRKS